MARESFREELARMKAEKMRAQDSMRSAFEASPAVLVRERGHEELWLLSPETVAKDGNVRITYLSPDGPRGHFSGKDLEDLVRELSSTRQSYEPKDEAFVIAWTSTPKYQEGVLQVALVQADNQLRWLAGQKGEDAYAWAMSVREDALDAKDVETATKMLERAAADLQAGRAPNTLKERLLNAFR